MADRLGPNDTQPCGTAAARMRHAAHGQTCGVCGPAATAPDPVRRAALAQLQPILWRIDTMRAQLDHLRGLLAGEREP